jgi:hypothetical protein
MEDMLREARRITPTVSNNASGIASGEIRS